MADHHSGAIIWAKPGRNAATLEAFLELLGDRCHTIKAISADMSAGYENAITAVAQADEQFRPEVVFDPYHVCQLASQAVDRVRRAEWNEHGKSTTGGSSTLAGRCSRRPSARPSSSSRGSPRSHAPTSGSTRAFLPKEELRLLYHLPDPEQAPSASRRGWRGPALQAQTVHHARAHDPQLPRRDPRRRAPGPQQRQLEGLNSKVRLVSHRSYGFHGPEPLISLIYLCAGGVTIDLPFTPKP